MKQISLSLLALSLLLAACGANTSSPQKPDPAPTEAELNVVVAEGVLAPTPSVELAFPQPGVVKEVLVAHGQQVAEGEVIARLQNIEALQAQLVQAEEVFLLAEQAFDGADAQALSALAAANENLRRAQYDFDNFDIPSDLQDMTPSEALIVTHTNLETSRENFAPYKYLEERLEWELRRENPDKKKVYRNTAKIYKKRLDDAWAEYNKAIRWAELESDLEAAKAELNQARVEWDRLHAGENAQELSVARAKFESAQANLIAARAALGGHELCAPFTGTLLSADLVPGEPVSPGVPVAFLADTARWQVETTDLAEINIVKVSLNDRVTVQLDAFPGEEFAGRVVEIDPVGREYLGDMTYQVAILLDEADERFKWNMTAIVTIHTE